MYQIIFEFLVEFAWVFYSMALVSSVLLVVCWLGKQIE